VRESVEIILVECQVERGREQAGVVNLRLTVKWKRVPSDVTLAGRNSDQ
jgi:hypothetical protein